MRDVAVVGFAQRQMAEFDGSPTCVELLVPLLAECYEQTGWTRRDVGFWCSGSSDYLAGRSFSFVSAVDAIGPLVAPIPRDAAALALLIALASACAIIAVRHLGLLRGKASAAILVIATVGTLAFGLVVAGQEIVARDGRAVIRTAGVLKEGAHARFEDVAQIFAGERVRVVRRESGWVEVQAADGVTGWIPDGTVIDL